MTAPATFGSKGYTFDINFVSSLVELDQRISSFYSNTLHATTQVLKLEVGACFWALKLLIIIFKVDAFVIVQIDHLLWLGLTLSLCG